MEQCLIRRLNANELETALQLVWKTFCQFEAKEYTKEGITSFKQDIIDNEAFHLSCLTNRNRMWGAFKDTRLVGVFVMRGESHLCLAFVEGSEHRKGIATALFQHLIHDVQAENPDISAITVNSAPYGIPFYHHVGFVDTDVEQTKNGVRFTPMIYIIKTAE